MHGEAFIAPLMASYRDMKVCVARMRDGQMRRWLPSCAENAPDSYSRSPKRATCIYPCDLDLWRVFCCIEEYNTSHRAQACKPRLTKRIKLDQDQWRDQSLQSETCFNLAAPLDVIDSISCCSDMDRFRVEYSPGYSNLICNHYGVSLYGLGGIRVKVNEELPSAEDPRDYLTCGSVVHPTDQYIRSRQSVTRDYRMVKT
ncbi:hypothetical protein RRG08_063540 [Elysia crispata]|uniref:Uncharacterized protein n=1 Tax=Elysia crispata TaxID=231223 RepID=A0AAE0YNP0_9GAST|nr:hypothetical protein RRG08_063540 [Elysia crispata]